VAYTAVVVRVLIASPGDVDHGRDTTRKSILDWNSANSKDRGIVLQPVQWEKDSFASYGDPAQANLNRQIVDTSDMLIGLFRWRLGTRTGVAVSGTAEEIERFAGFKKPVALYFSTEPVPRKVDRVEFNRLLKFKEQIKHRGLIFEYGSVTDLSDTLTRQLPMMVKNSSACTLAPPFDEVNELTMNLAREELRADRSVLAILADCIPHLSLQAIERLDAEELMGHVQKRFAREANDCFWWMIVYGVLKFKDIDQFYDDNGEHYQDAIDYVELASRGKQLLKYLKLNADSVPLTQHSTLQVSSQPGRRTGTRRSR